MRTKNASNKKYFYIIFPVLLFVAAGVMALSLKYNREKQVGGCGCENPQTADGTFQSEETTAYFQGRPISPLLAELPEPVDVDVLGDVSPDNKWIEIDLSDQKLTAWEGNNKFLESLVSSGKTGRTPTGEFRIWSKYKYTKMSGGSKEDGTYYYLPNVPYTMYFNGSYGLHGTYWHNNFGTPMSHGCVNLPTLVAEKLFYWSSPVVPAGKNSIAANSANLGTKVVIHD